MDNVTMIAAVGQNRELGKSNGLIWNIKEDMNFFKEMTINKPVVMGRNTYKSLKRPLKDRQNIVLTTRAIELKDNTMVIRSIENLLKYIEEYKEEVMIIGGAKVYKEMLEYAKKIYLTEIEEKYPKADTYFPRFNKDLYDINLMGEYVENGIKYKRKVYTKK